MILVQFIIALCIAYLVVLSLLFNIGSGQIAFWCWQVIALFKDSGRLHVGGSIAAADVVQAEQLHE